MNAHSYTFESLCATFERQEQVFSDDEMRRVTTAIGGRIVEAFNFLSEAEIASLLKTSCKTVRRLIESEELPTTEMLLCIQKVTGVSIDWILTGEATQKASLQTPSYLLGEVEPLDIAFNENANQNGLKTGLW
jgi:plasmid maintenance system antidote protein VapI